jgi:hypothetical protein
MYLAWTFAVPGVYLRCTRGRHFRRSWPCPAPRWSANRFTFTRGAGLGGRGRLRLARGRGYGPCPGTPRWRPWPAEGKAGCRCRVLARERCPANVPWRGRRLDRHREDVATYRGRVRRPRAGRFPASPLTGLPRCRSGGPPAGLRGPGRDGQRKWQTVCPGSRTCRRSTPPANPGTNTGTCRQRTPLSAADVQDTARINLPVHSQTDISAKLLKQSSMARRTCVPYVNYSSPVRAPVSTN